MPRRYFRKIWSAVFPIVSVCFILGAALSIIAYGRGYRLDITKKSLAPTGLLVATSDPTGAQILINSKLHTATNATLNVPPGWYSVQIVKDRYQTWEKKLRVQGEIVSRADAFLIPTNPSLTALTTNGVQVPAVSPDGTKIAYVTPRDPTSTISGTISDRSGIWLLDLADRPLGFNRDARLLTKATNLNLHNATLFWSPDSKQLLIQVITPLPKSTKPTKSNTPLPTSYYSLDTDKQGNTLTILPNIKALFAMWSELKTTKNHEQQTSLPIELLPTFHSAMNVLSFSPDETKILYEATASGVIPQIVVPPLNGTNPTEETRTLVSGNIYVYDIKEDRNYLLGDSKTIRQLDNKTITSTCQGFSLPVYPSYCLTVLPSPIQWLPTSRHLLMVTKDALRVMEYDGQNNKILYSGPFSPGYAWPWTASNKILILTNLNSSTSLSNLYTLNLR